MRRGQFRMTRLFKGQDLLFKRAVVKATVGSGCFFEECQGTVWPGDRWERGFSESSFVSLETLLYSSAFQYTVDRKIVWRTKDVNEIKSEKKLCLTKTTLPTVLH